VAEPDWPRAQALADALGMPPLLAQLLVARGADDPEVAHAFLNPGLRQLADPYLLTDMDRAVARITQARDRGEHVRVFGDYDVDGIAASALLINGLRRFGVAKVSHGMPSRFAEGYGLGIGHVEQARQDGVALIVTVDNGISAHAAADAARRLGVDLVVTDHHSIEAGLPDALAVINPRREAPDHPMALLCGAGVAFKLSTALNGTPNDLDIAALGTVADLVPLRGENRAIVALGLRHMAKHSRVGIRELAAAADLRNGAITAENIAFQLGPRINAAGRMDDGLPALQLLLTDDPEEARGLARMLSEANQDRRAMERMIYEEAVEELEATLQTEQRGIVIARRGWHPGVIGIVAARIENRFRRPVVVISVDESGEGKGSARAGEGFDMVGAFAATQNLLVRYGGHRAAAGLSIREENIGAFREAFEAEARRQLGTAAATRTLRVDAVAALSQIDAALLDGLARLEPCGCENPAPVFCSHGVSVVPGSVRVLKDAHLKLMVRQADAVLPVIGFGMAERHYTEGFGETLDIAYVPQLNTYRGETSIQLMLRDFRPA
jgi:single-stranded-DNA-specific exonuclease